MKSSDLLLLFGWIALPVHATKHHLFVGTFLERSIYALKFDDATLALTLTANISASDTHTWITLSHNHKALYGSGIGSDSWYSYTIHNSSSLTPSAALPLKGNCISPLPGPNAGNGPSGLHSVAASKPPYAFYGAGPTCGNVLQVDPATGALLTVAQDIPYFSATSGLNSTLMHGMALSADGRFLYGVDTRGNSIWTYTVHNQTGELDLVDAMPGPVPGSNPRHVATHPGGGYLYMVLEGANALTQYRVEKGTGRPARESVSWPLIKPGLFSPDIPHHIQVLVTVSDRCHSRTQLIRLVARRSDDIAKREIPLGDEQGPTGGYERVH